MSRIKKIEFKNFRVYKDQEFEIDSNARIVLIHGNNGFGKTSFFDGIEWGLTGIIQRYDKASREKNDYDVLRNTLVDKKEDSYVKLSFDDDETLKRSVVYMANKDYNSGILKSDFIIDEKLISDGYRGKIKFEDSFCFSQFLSQELIDRFIREMKDTDRYNSIKNILGLHRYEKYEVFIDAVNIETFSRLKILNEERINLENKIKVAIAKKTTISLNEEILKLRYDKYIGDHSQIVENNIIVQRLENKITENIKIYEKLDEKIRSNNQNAIELDELNEVRFDSFIKNQADLITTRNDINKNKVVIDNIKYYHEIKYLNDNMKMYLNVINQKGENSKVKIDYEIKSDRYSKTKAVNRSFESIINFFELGNMHLDSISGYRTILKDILNINKSISDKSIELERMMSFKQEFINTTLNYLKANVNLQKCPVCRQSFNLGVTINQLSEELKNNSDVTLNAIIKELNQEKTTQETFENQKKKFEEQLTLEFINIQDKLEEEMINLRQKVNVVTNSESFAKEYLIKLSKQGIEIDKINTEYEKYSNIISSLSGSKEEEVYLGVAKNLEEKELKLINEIGHFKKRIEKYDIKNYNEVELNRINLKLKINDLDVRMNKEKTEITELKEMLSHYNNNIQNNSLNLLNYELKKLNIELKKVKIISESFEYMGQNGRDVMLNEIDRILKSDDFPIKILYNYLNPNYNFQKLNFRIDKSNPKNNRLMLEAISENGAVINPAYSFSSAQNNVLAVSIFLSFALTQEWSNLDCIFMDDPIQNMDDININNFVDIIRNVVRTTNKQFFISTHDIRIFEFMKNKFGNNTQLINFIDYGCKG